MMGIVILAFCIVVVLLSGRWTLGPLEYAAAGSKARMQFAIADILCLFVQIQLVLAVVFQLAQRMGLHKPDSSTVVVLTLLTAGFWWRGVLLLERTGVRNVWHRAFVLVVGIPVKVMGAIVLCVMLELLLVLWSNHGENLEMLWAALIALATVGLQGSVRLATTRIVAAAQRRNTDQLPASEVA